MTFSYLLAIFLVILGLIGLRYSYMSSTLVDSFDQAIVVETPGTSPIWISSNIGQFSDPNMLPGGLID